MGHFNKRLIFVASLSLFFNMVTLAQKVTMNINNVTVKQAIEKLQKKTGYSVTFYATDVNTEKRIDVKAKNLRLSEVLKQILSDQNLTYEISGKTIIVRRLNTDTKKQEVKFKASGQILDENGNPVIGATVIQKNAKDNGTVTDIDGRYELSVPKGSTLIVSYIGYTEQEVKASHNSNIFLKVDAQNLQDVVVIGYGTARKADLTGSTSSLSGDRLTASNSPQLSQQLQGQMAGVQVTRSTGDPSSSSTIRVRGITTISTNDPLVIIDGVPGYLDDVASEDVKDIQVLKDAASAAIYGSRAAAGVILITTKRAKNKNFSLNYDMEYGIDSATEKPSYTNIVQWMTGYNELAFNDGASSLYSAYSEDLIKNYASLRASDPDSYPDTNWMDLGLKSSTSHTRHSLSLSGGTEKLKTNFSLNYYNADALYDYKHYEKYNVRCNNDYNINSWIHANVDLNLVYNRSVTPHNMEGTVMWDFMDRSPLYNAYWSNGTYADAKGGDNPLAAHELGGSVSGRNYTVNGKIQLDITPIKNLTLTAVAAPKWYFYKGKDHRTKYKVYNQSGEEVYGAGFGSTDVSEYRNDNHSLTMQFYANYKLQFARHSISAMTGYEDYSYFWENESAWRTNYNLDNFPYLNLGPEDYQYNNGTAGHNAYRSIFGRIMYSWAERYLLQANVRSDGSSRFAKGHRWGTFPSVSAGWVISEEPWFKNGGVVNYLKLRASIGQLGNERIGSEFPYQAALQFGTGLIPNASTGSADVTQTAYQMTYAFKDITWETTTTYGVGIDLTLLQNRLRFSGDYYYKKTTDMLLAVGFPSYFGYNSPQNNAADMHTKGWDIELAWNDHINDFKYGANFNISDYRSKMGYMADKQVISGNKITEEGSYYNEWFGYKSQGIILNENAMYDSNGNKIPVLTNNDKPGCIKYADIDENGKITASGDRVRLGNSLPEYQYGGSLWAEWKNFDFNLTFQGVGHQLCYWNWAVTPFKYQAYSCPSALYESHWSPTATDEVNAKAKYPFFSTNESNIYAYSDFYLFNGAYMRIKNLTLGYTVPSNITKKFFVNKLRIYFSVNDLPAFSNYPDGYDPEWNQYSDLITTSCIFGLNVTF